MAAARFGHFVSDVAFSAGHKPSIPTRVLHVAQSSSAAVAAGNALPTHHYWVMDFDVLPSGIEYFRAMGYAIIDATVYSSRSMWERRYDRDAPLHPEHIFRPHGVPSPHPDAATPA